MLYYSVHDFCVLFVYVFVVENNTIKNRAKPIKSRFLNKVKHCLHSLLIALLYYFIATQGFGIFEGMKEIIFCLLFLSFAYAKGQGDSYSVFESKNLFHLYNKTDTLFPSSTAKYKEHKIIAFEPFLQYHYFPVETEAQSKVAKSIRDSSFHSKLAKTENNYITYPTRQAITNKHFTNQYRQILRKHKDTSIIYLTGDTAKFIKKELDSIIQLAEKVDLREYKISNKLYEYVNRYKATEYVFINISVYQIYHLQYLKFDLLVFENSSQKIFYYDNICQYSKMRASVKDVKEIYGGNGINGIGLKHVLKKYKYYLKHNRMKNHLFTNW